MEKTELNASEKTVKIIKEIIPYILIIIAVLLIKRFLFTTVQVHGQSMDDTLHENDVLILDRISYKFSDIKRFDVVVVDIGNEQIIKRVVGLPGEHIYYKNNDLYVNGEKIKDKYGNGDTYDFDLNHINLETIPDDCYFVLGDNRENSLDSRILGVINKKDIVGKARFFIYPFNKIGKVK